MLERCTFRLYYCAVSIIHLVHNFGSLGICCKSSITCRRAAAGDLDLLSAPTSGIGLAHVGRGFDGGNKLESDIGNTDNTDDTTGDVANDLLAEEEAAEEDVD